MFAEYNFKNYSFRLVFYAVALNLIGVAAIYSAEGGSMSYTSRQLIGMFAGLLMAIVLSLINYRHLLRFSGIIYAGCIVILLAVIVAGQLGGGSRRWITLPVIGRFQPSEFVKIGLILFFSWFLQKNQEKIDQPLTLLIAAALAGIPLYLIVDQPDLSTTIVIAFIIVCLVFIAGISYRWVFGVAFAALAAVVGIVFMAERGILPPFMHSYQVNRVLAFVYPSKYAELAELSIQQDNSKMAIGSGQLYGKGLLNDTVFSVKNGNFLSEEHTDFIFSVIGEELGFVGGCLVLVLFVLFVYECLRIANRAGDLSGKLIGTGMAALVGFQAFTNIAVVTGMFPNTGLTLPFISYGVSSLVSLYIGTGIILNVGLQQRKLEF